LAPPDAAPSQVVATTCPRHPSKYASKLSINRNDQWHSSWGARLTPNTPLFEPETRTADVHIGFACCGRAAQGSVFVIMVVALQPDGPRAVTWRSGTVDKETKAKSIALFMLQRDEGNKSTHGWCESAVIRGQANRRQANRPMQTPA
jgi:hypothetical protein